MQNILAAGDRKTNGYAMYIGRWQPWHAGHRWMIDEQLNQGKKVLLCIRDVKEDEHNPWSAYQVIMNLEEQLKDLIEAGKVKVMIIPDIESVNFGRGVGYDVIEHVPPEEIKQISATKIKEQMRKEGLL